MKNRRDVFEWIVVGYLLGHPDRDTEVEKIPPSLLSGQQRILVNSMRPENKGRELLAWMEEQKAPVEKGSTAIETIIAALASMNRRQKIKRMVERIRLLDFDTDNEDVIRKNLEECLKMVEPASE